jgi:hypothetical protein
MKKLILPGLLLAIGLGSYMYYTSEPKFYIKSYDRLTKSGVFVFSGGENSFYPGKGGSASGRNGYSIRYYTGENNIAVFELYKNGQFLRKINPYQLQA